MRRDTNNNGSVKVIRRRRIPLAIAVEEGKKSNFILYAIIGGSILLAAIASVIVIVFTKSALVETQEEIENPLTAEISGAVFERGKLSKVSAEVVNKRKVPVWVKGLTVDINGVQYHGSKDNMSIDELGKTVLEKGEKLKFIVDIYPNRIADSDYQTMPKEKIRAITELEFPHGQIMNVKMRILYNDEIEINPRQRGGREYQQKADKDGKVNHDYQKSLSIEKKILVE